MRQQAMKSWLQLSFAILIVFSIDTLARIFHEQL